MLDKPVLKDWVTAAEASRILDCEKWELPVMARTGLISIKGLPQRFVRPLYLRVDCERLAQVRARNLAARNAASRDATT
jgi:hypothetical protein